MKIIKWEHRTFCHSCHTFLLIEEEDIYITDGSIYRYEYGYRCIACGKERPVDFIVPLKLHDKLRESKEIRDLK